MPVKNLLAIQKATGNVTDMSEFYKNTGCLAPYLFTFETMTKNAKIHTRFFALHLGIIEDPATGSAAGPSRIFMICI